MLNVSVGFRFNPAEEELVRYYLANRVAGNSQDLWRGLINEFDMYTEEPWELWGRFYRPNLGGNNLVEAKSDQYIYFFTPLKKVASCGNGKRVKRRVGTSGGTWHKQNSKKCKGGGGVSWFERRFSYKNNKCKEQDGAWLMMEFCFHEDDNLVLCQIGKKPLLGGVDGEDHRCYNSIPRGRSTGSGTTFQASSPVVYDVNDDNFTVPGTKVKRMRMEGIFSCNDVSIVDGEQVQPHGGVGFGFGNQGAMTLEIPYQNQGTIVFNSTRIDEVEAISMGIPYHHEPDFVACNQEVDGSFSTTCTESGLPEPTSIRLLGSLCEQTSGIGNTGEADQENNAIMSPNTRIQEEEEIEADMRINALDDPNRNSAEEDYVDVVDLDNIVVGNMDELDEAMMKTYPKNYDNINGGPTMRMQEKEEEDMGTKGLDDLRRRMQEEDMERNNCDHDPGLMNWDEHEEIQRNCFDDWIAEYQRDQSTIQLINVDD